VIFEKQFPRDVPGLENLEPRRGALENLLSQVKPDADGVAKVGRGRIIAGDLEGALQLAGVAREPMLDLAGMVCVRRAAGGGKYYFIANRSDQSVIGWIPLAASAAQAVLLMDPLSGRVGAGELRARAKGGVEVYLELRPGESLVVRTSGDKKLDYPVWDFWHLAYTAGEIKGEWHMEFLAGGPVLPASFAATNLASWTENADTNARSFAGTARYTITFDAPDTDTRQWLLHLGKVCESARVKLNGKDFGTLFVSPFRVVVDNLKPKDNRLEVEVTGTSANRIRDLDRRGVAWKNFHDINFVNQFYKPFDASDWPLAESGLLGPVTLTAIQSSSQPAVDGNARPSRP
jgi:hypothetical protein